jgi:hypothetical protein
MDNKSTIVDVGNNFAALQNFNSEELADYIANNQVRLDQVLGNPSPIPTFLGPTFGSIPQTKQEGPIKLQTEDGYQ